MGPFRAHRFPAQRRQRQGPRHEEGRRGGEEAEGEGRGAGRLRGGRYGGRGGGRGRPDREARRRSAAAIAAAAAADGSQDGENGDDEEGGRRSRKGRSSRSSASLDRSPDGVTGGGASAAGGGANDDDNDAEGRLTRRQRRKRAGTADDPFASSFGTAGGDVSAGAAAAGASGVGSISGAGAVAVEEHIGKDVVATVPAQELDEHEGLDEASLREHEEVTKVKNVARVELGKYRMDTWYFSPLPKELLKDGKGVIDVLYVCEFTLNFFTRKEELRRHLAKELLRGRRHPPGNEIYRNGNLSMFEVDGFEERIYCQNLCYIAKLFLDHKTLYFDVDPFLFYVLCEVDDSGFHPVGYYSKEKYSDVGYNLACILTFPSHQRKGYGRFLISFSYELTKKEEKVGSPEKPISDLGQQAYLPYWTSIIIDFLRNRCRDASSISIMDISKQTSIMVEDIVFALNQLGILKFINGVYFIAAEKALLEDLAKRHPIKEPRVNPSKLHWTPFLTDVKRDKFSIHSKRPSVEREEQEGWKTEGGL